MSDEMLFTVFIIAVTMLAVLIAKLASFITRFADETRYICMEMDRADSYEEYRKWRGELRCHNLCLIPFVTEKNVMRLYDRIYHRADRGKDKERKDSLAPLLMPSILGIFLCLVCVCGMTWAWYTAGVETPAQKLTAAYYEVTVKSITNPSGGTVDLVDGKYSLDKGTPYTVTLTASGTVDKCGGYCLIQNTANGEKTYTQTFEPDDNIVVQFTPTLSGGYTFTGVWGSLPVGTENYLPHTDFATAPINDPEPSDTAEPETNETEPPDTAEPETNETEPPDTEPIEKPATEPVNDAPVVAEASDTSSTPDDFSAPTEQSQSEE